MEFLTQSRPINLPDFNAPRHVEFREAVKAKDAPDFLSEFQFAQTLIPLEGGQQSLRLLKPLQLKVSPDLCFTVIDWGIEMDCGKLADLPREVARRFLF